MPKIMQNLVFLMESSENAEVVSLKFGDMCLNRFCIDEDAAFELSCVHYLKTTSFAITFGKTTDMKSKRESKGTGNSSRLEVLDYFMLWLF